MSFADPIEEQQSPGGSVTRVSGTKGGKKSIRSKVSFLQPRRLSQESKKDHTTEREVCTYLCKDMLYDDRAALPLPDASKVLD